MAWGEGRTRRSGRRGVLEVLEVLEVFTLRKNQVA